MNIEIQKKVVSMDLYLVESFDGEAIEYDTPKDAAKASIYYWLSKRARVDSLSQAVSYLLREGTDELVAKVEELREWLKKEERIMIHVPKEPYEEMEK